MIYNLYEKRSEKNANIHDLTKIQKKTYARFYTVPLQKKVSATETRLTIQNDIYCKRSSEFGKT